MLAKDENTVGRGVLIAWLIYIVWMLDVISVVFIQSLEELCGVSLGRNQSIYATCVSVLFACIVGWTVHRKYRSGIKYIDYISLFKYILLVILDIVVAWGLYAIGSICILLLENEFKGINILVNAALIVSILGIYIQLAAAIVWFLQKNIHKRSEEDIKKNLNEQRRQYDILAHQEKETRKFRHDVRNHMYMLSDMAKHKEYDSIKQYVKEMENKLDSLKDNALM